MYKSISRAIQSEPIMKIAKLFVKMMAFVFAAGAFALVSCEKTMEGAAEDAADAVEATKDAGRAVAEKAGDVKDAAKKKINDAAKKVEKATSDN
jgi:predicted small secreted protein